MRRDVLELARMNEESFSLSFRPAPFMPLLAECFLAVFVVSDLNIKRSSPRRDAELWGGTRKNNFRDERKVQNDFISTNQWVAVESKRNNYLNSFMAFKAKQVYVSHRAEVCAADLEFRPENCLFVPLSPSPALANLPCVESRFAFRIFFQFQFCAPLDQSRKPNSSQPNKHDFGDGTCWMLNRKKVSGRMQNAFHHPQFEESIGVSGTRASKIPERAGLESDFLRENKKTEQKDGAAGDYSEKGKSN